MTVLHAGGKFNHSNYKVSGGLHGVGVSVVNALSEWLKLEIKRDGKTWYQEYRRGDPGHRARRPSASPTRPAPRSPSSPDPEIFKGTEFSFEILSQRLRELAYLNRGLTITLEDERTGKTHEFHFEGGIAQFVADLSTAKSRHPRQAGRWSRARWTAPRSRSRCQWNDSYPGDDLLLHQQHQEQGRRHPPHRLPRRPHPHGQRLRPGRRACSRT